MAIIGRMTARQRLRRATEQSLLFPAFSEPANCTERVIGGLWPAQLNSPDAEVARLARYLRRDLGRIADSANDKLHRLNKRGLSDDMREAEEARVIDAARTFAVRRVDSTMRQLPKKRTLVAKESLTQWPLRDQPLRRHSRDDTRVIVSDRPRAPRHRRPTARTESATRQREEA